MPYISKEAREEILSHFRGAHTPGELNFEITTDILRYLKREKISYARFNEVMGVLACVQGELYRRMIAPYENKKKKENGEIFL